MHNRENLYHIRMENLSSVLEQEDVTLVACLLQDEGFEGQLDMLARAARILIYDLRLSYITDDLIAYFKTEYGIEGTPTFLLLRKGQSLGRLLGRTTTEELIDFARRALVAIAAPAALRGTPHEAHSR